MRMMGEPKYPAGFQQFDYVNPNAPKGGLVRLGAQGTFDSFNLAIGAVKGEVAAGIGAATERADLLAHLRTLSGAPKPLPAP